MHYTRQTIVDAIAGHTSLTIELHEGDTAWNGQTRPRVLTGPGVITFRHGVIPGSLRVAGEDYPEGDPESDAYRAAVAELHAQADVNLPA